MKKHINTNFRQFILEQIKNAPHHKKGKIEEVQPDEIIDYEELDEEPEEEPLDLDDEDEILDDEVQDEDDLIRELYQKYKKLRQQYEHRLHQRKARKILR